MPGKPKPTKLKVITGNPGKRPLPDNEPEPDNIIPDMPKTIDSDAQKTWKKLAPMLKRIGLVTEADGDMLAALCQIQARLSQIHKEMKTANREIIKLDRLYKKYMKTEEPEKASGVKLLSSAFEKNKSVLMKEERHYSALFRQYGSEFGLSPRGRTGLVVSGSKKDKKKSFLT